MDSAHNSPPDRPEIALARPANGRDKRKRHVATKAQLLTRDQLDGRTNAAKLFDRLVTDIETDLGGRDRLSTIELQLIEAFCGAAVTLQHLNTQLALGQKIDLTQHSAAVGAMVRVASRLGLQRRRAKDVGPSLQQYLAENYGRREAHRDEMGEEREASR